jgi:hypothetical protein
MTYRALVLLDIDGTLVRCAGPNHREALVHAIRRVTGLESTTDGIPVARDARSERPTATWEETPLSGRGFSIPIFPVGIKDQYVVVRFGRSRTRPYFLSRSSAISSAVGSKWPKPVNPDFTTGILPQPCLLTSALPSSKTFAGACRDTMTV